MRGPRKVTRAARKLYRLCHADGVLDAERVRHVAQQIAKSERRGTLAILSAFQRLVRLDRNRHTAIVESASTLESALQQGVQADLARLYGPGITTSFAENPGLIGGMRIKVGSDVYDGSVRGRLQTLITRL
jgi:F-type H+-transporting ATPase subunit delta